MKSLIVLILLLLPQTVFAQDVTVPLNIGVGPTLNWVTGPVAKDQTFHLGLRFTTYLAIGQKERLKYMKHIPKQYRNMARKKGEIRFDPMPWYVPRSFTISPKFRNTGMYGLTFRPIGLGIALGELRLSAGLLFSYLFIHSDTLPSPTHFLRPGAEIKASLELPLDKRRNTAVSIEWASQFYIPQNVGGKVLEVGEIDSSVWHIGQIIFMLHKRVDLTLNIRDYL